MPQMAPINWLFLFILFSLTLIIFNIINYYLINPINPEDSSQSLQKNSLNWKW
uniref:ATP synthase complex subunit 8 n=1 Tax=Protochauliodes biconicus TaxID=1452981 RepID=A0A343DRD0_9NEOP|nr:ATP synthase F0 subunit 8 [Protochauliodes biconicus]